jgi:hypothetical protein
MAPLHTSGAIHLLQIFSSAFLAILFLQSGIDKVIDHRSNLEWLKGHFAKSPLAAIVRWTFPVESKTRITRAEARTALGIIDCLTFLGEHRFNCACLKNFPAPTVRSNFNNRGAILTPLRKNSRSFFHMTTRSGNVAAASCEA